MRHEVKRFVYMCDGMETHAKKCKSTQVIDAVTHQEADNLAKANGWTVDKNGCLCNNGTHKKIFRRSNRVAELVR